jgi:hypothetical protein
MIAFVIECAINNSMWLYDYVVELDLSLLSSNHKWDYCHKHHSIIFITMIMWNAWQHMITYDKHMTIVMIDELYLV